MVPEPLVTVGWDVGGVQVKAARVESRSGVPDRVRIAVRPFEVWRGRERLPEVLRDVAAELEVDATTPLALTMTAELSDVFRTKREGVLFVMDAVREAFPENLVAVLDCHGCFAALHDASLAPPRVRGHQLGRVGAPGRVSRRRVHPRGRGQHDHGHRANPGGSSGLRRPHRHEPAERRRAGVHRRAALQSQHADGHGPRTRPALSGRGRAFCADGRRPRAPRPSAARKTTRAPRPTAGARHRMPAPSAWRASCAPTGRCWATRRSAAWRATWSSARCRS